MYPCTLLPYTTQSGQENMEVDRQMALECSKAFSKPLLRFYRWTVPTLSLGYNQHITNDINTTFCADNNIEIVTRPSGGKAVFHSDEITYCIASSLDNDLFPHTILERYKKINTALIAGLRRLGVEAIMNEEKKSQNIPANCFASFAPYEILVEGKKIIGSAQRKFKNAFLQHGSLLFSIERSTLSALFHKAHSREFEMMISLYEVIPETLQVEQIIEELVEGFKEVFDFSC